MYLTKLYRYNKWLFTGIVFFITMQLLVSYKRGMVVSPWYNYGMYSEKMYPQPMYEVNYELTGPAWLYLIAPQYDDKVNVTLDNYRKSSANDSLYHKEIPRLFAKLHLPVPAKKHYQCRLRKQAFERWFKKKQRMSTSVLQTSSLQTIFEQPAFWNGRELKLSRMFHSDSNGTILFP